MSGFQKLCLLSDLSNHKPKKISINDLSLLAVLNASGQIFVFNSQCTHQDKSLENGKWDAQSAQITCPFHKAVFAIAEGGVVKAPPACIPLRVYEVQTVTEQDGSTWVYYLDDV